MNPSGDINRPETNGTDELSGLQLIAAERQRQITEEGYTTDSDDNKISQSLALAASCYALPWFERPESDPPEQWPWGAHYWKPSRDDRIRELVKAGALIVAEIDRLQRAAVSS